MQDQQFRALTEDKGIAFHSCIAITLLIVNNALNYGINLFLARLLTPAGFGDFSVTYRLLTFCSLIALLGADQAAIKLLPEYLVQYKWGNIRGYLLQSVKKIVLVCTIIVSSVTLFALTLNLLISFNVTDVNFQHPIAFIIWLAPLFAVAIFFGEILRGLGYYTSSVLTARVLKPFFAFISIMIYAYLVGVMSPHIALLCFGVSMVIVIIIQVALLRKYLPKKIFESRPHDHREVWRPLSLHLMFMSLVYTGTYTSLGLISAELIFLEIIGKSEKDVGIFSALMILIGFIWIISAAVTIVIGPKISPAIVHHDKTRLQSIINKGTMVLGGGSILLGAVISIFSKPLMLLFGKTFLHGSDALLIVAAGTMIESCLGLSQPILSYSGYHKQATLVIAYSMVFCLIANITLIPLLELNGAAIALVLTRLSMVIGSYYVAKRKLGVVPLAIRKK